MSGGVDSSVAAALLAREGHDVIGLSMQLYDHSGSHADGEVRFGSCCTIDDLYDARRVATQLGIPHYIVNFESQFGEHVIANFVRESGLGCEWILETHAHADHLSAAPWLQAAVGGKIAIGQGIREVQKTFRAILNLEPAFVGAHHIVRILGLNLVAPFWLHRDRPPLP